MVALRSMVACLFMLTLGLPLTAESQPSNGFVFIPLATPCRALDTRVTGAPIPADVPTTIQISGITTGGETVASRTRRSAPRSISRSPRRKGPDT